MNPRAASRILFAAALLALGACSGQQRERDEVMQFADGPGGRMLMVRPGMDPNAAYAQGLDLKTRGDCPAAVVKLRPVANLGPGYENAQTALGSCLLVIGGKAKDLSSDYLDGMTWLRRAADAGWPEAQGALAMAHMFGPSAIRNGEEAAYWLTLYETNSGRMHIGFTPLKDADVTTMERALSTADKNAGVARAQQWVRQIWLPPPQQAGVGPERSNGTRGEGQGQRRRFDLN